MRRQTLFSTGGDFPKIAPLLAELMTSSMYHGVQDMERQVEELRGGKTRRFGDWTDVLPEEALAWIGTYTPTLVRVLEESLLEKCREEISNGMRRGLTNEEVMRELGRTFDRFSQFRLETIVRTESMRAYNLGSIIGMKNARGVAGVEFLAILDERVTPQCEARNGMRLRLDDPHIINNTPPLHPRCRSVLIPLLDDEVDEGWKGDSDLAARLEIDEPGIQRDVDIEAVRKVWQIPQKETLESLLPNAVLDFGFLSGRGAEDSIRDDMLAVIKDVREISPKIVDRVEYFGDYQDVSKTPSSVNSALSGYKKKGSPKLRHGTEEHWLVDWNNGSLGDAAETFHGKAIGLNPVIWGAGKEWRDEYISRAFTHLAMPSADGRYILTHEMGHVAHDFLKGKIGEDALRKWYNSHYNEIRSISKYAKANYSEGMAECFAEGLLIGKSTAGKALLRLLRKVGSR